MATFWEIAAHSAHSMLSFYFDYFDFSYFPFWFVGWVSFVIASIPYHCILFISIVLDGYQMSTSMRYDTFLL